MAKKEEPKETHSFVIHLPGVGPFPIVVDGPVEYAKTVAEKWANHFHGLGPRVECTDPPAPEDEEVE